MSISLTAKCEACCGSGETGLLGAKGLGMYTKMCRRCAGSGINLEAKSEEQASMDAEAKMEVESNAAADVAVYHLVEPSMYFAKKVYSTSSTIFVFGRLVRFGVAVADVGVSRLTPWRSVEAFGAHVADFAPYIDEKVISPRVNIAKDKVEAFCGSMFKAGSEVLLPYVNFCQKTARQIIVSFEPHAREACDWARPILTSVWYDFRPSLQIVEKTDKINDAKYQALKLAAA